MKSLTTPVRMPFVALGARLAITLAMIMGSQVNAQVCELAETQKLSASDGMMLDNFGISTAVDGEVAVVGAWLRDIDSSNLSSGGAYVYRLGMNGMWIEEAELSSLVPELDAGDLFGWAVDVSGDVIAVSAHLDDGDLNDVAGAGAVYVFRYNAGQVWELDHKINAPGAAGDQFGFSLGLDGSTMVVGAPLNDTGGPDRGVAYVYSVGVGGSTLDSTLMASDGADGDEFGFDTDVDDGNVVVGAPNRDVGGNNAGGVYVYDAVNAEQILGGFAAGDFFGNAVAIDGMELVVGAPRSDAMLANAGAAYVYELNGANWELAAGNPLVATDAQAGDQLGSAVGLGDGIIVAGARFRDVGGSTQVGATAMFAVDENIGSWVESAVLLPMDIVPVSFFGHAVSISDTGTAVIGATLGDDGMVDTGTAYIFDVRECNGNGVPDSCDLDGGGSDDCNENGIPDECDIEAGFSQDCNDDGGGNGIPDECEIDMDSNAPGGPFFCDPNAPPGELTECDPDCNENGIPDECDIDSGTSVDCNGNGIPDECDSANCPPDDPFCQDCNGNGTLDGCDIDESDPDGNGEVSGDCNGNQIPDECDIADGTSEDCNINDVPDDCDIDPTDPDGDGEIFEDCNANGIPDVCDIAMGTSQDCQPDGIPDECQPDCDLDGIPDECEIDGGSPDCNGNGVPDDCDIDSGTSMDCNRDTIPDDCQFGEYEFVSDEVGPIDSGNSVMFMLESPPVVLEDFPLMITVRGDFSDPAKFIDLRVNGMLLGRYPGVTDCDPAGTTFPAIIRGYRFNQAVNGGDAMIELSASAAVSECEFSAIQLTFDYRFHEGFGIGDCNRNSMLDVCDIADGTSQDCNGNGIPDTCELPGSLVTFTSDQLGPIGGDDTPAITIPSPAPASSPIEFTITAFGDFGVDAVVPDTAEFFDFILNDEIISPLMVNLGRLCVPTPVTICTSPDQFNSLVEAVDAVFEFDASDPVDSDACGPDSSFVIMQYSYATFGPLGGADVNQDGALDSCDTCFGDIVENSAIDINDLLALLGAWGICPGFDEDLNNDGMVNVNDLLILLANWGPCV